MTSDALWFMTAGGKLGLPVPPVLDNRGKYVASLQKLTKWLGSVAEAAGADVFAAFPGQELLWDGDRVVGVRIGDKGIDRNGNHKPNYEPGPDLLAKVVIIGEGPRGTLAKQAISRLGLDRERDPQVYAVGIKELWQCAPGSVKAGNVIHTLGYPNPPELFGGGFIYGMADDVLDVGWVVGARLSRSDDRLTRSLPALQAPSRDQADARRGDLVALRREGDPGRRVVFDAAQLRRRSAGRRRQRRVPQWNAVEGDPPRD